ncbi:helix-turn-helix transcriptional regulator [Desulfomonile tiedjei]|uniref:Putative transcriptional regulator n=1 Tax=Desulfomonile tiedjei (strain ATCC 49306 / DSM 6799 / DCB-1) TaxID=706587 RepID=I4C1S6_DESTA|nr:YafY family protein [Desulfomonile tiedjei]AFM23517.1 putative transcriptional regulator [Desulfomonile tiedjei DSM 6799]
MRGTQLARQWRIIRLIENYKRGLSGNELSHELGIPLRTIYRDLEAIQEAGFPIYTEKVGKSSYWKLVDTFRKDFPLPLTATELMSLHMSRDILSIFEGTIFQESIESLFNKVKTVLSPETLRYLENISGRLKIGFASCKDFTSCREAITEISEATAKKRCVEILYKAVSARNETRRKIDPYQIWVMNGGFYLIGFCHLRKTVRTFAMDRIKDFNVLDEQFHLPRDFNLENYLRTAFNVMRGEPEKIRISVSSAAAHVIRERIFHPTQEVRELPDGGAEIFLNVPINYEIISWILGFGSAARVIEPDSLKNRIRDELRAAAANYDKPLAAGEAFTKKMPARLS